MSQVVIDQVGPLPISAPVTWPSDRSVLVTVTGSAFTKQAGSQLRVLLHIADTYIGLLRLTANTAGAHMVLPAAYFDLSGVIGKNTITLSADNGTTLTDGNDNFTVALIY